MQKDPHPTQVLGRRGICSVYLLRREGVPCARSYWSSRNRVFPSLLDHCVALGSFIRRIHPLVSYSLAVFCSQTSHRTANQVRRHTLAECKSAHYRAVRNPLGRRQSSRQDLGSCEHQSGTSTMKGPLGRSKRIHEAKHSSRVLRVDQESSTQTLLYETAILFRGVAQMPPEIHNARVSTGTSSCSSS